MSKKAVKAEEQAAAQQPVEVIPEIDISDAQTALEEAMMELIHNEPFYANLTLNMRREFTTKFPTLAVSVTDEINLHINPYFFKHLNLLERVDVIKHECLHVVNNHFVRFRDLEPVIYDTSKERTMKDALEGQQTASTLNYAADYAINEFLPNLPRKGVNLFDEKGKAMVYPPGTKDDKGNDLSGKAVKGNLLFVDDLRKKKPGVLKEESLEYYYEFLKEEQEKNKQNQQGQGQGQGQPQPGNGDMTLDDHGSWHMGNLNEDQITQKVKDVVNKAVEQTSAKDMGTLPGGIQQAIHQLNHVPKDWRQDIQRFAARCAEILIESTRKKRNRRYGIIYPGYKIQPKLHLALGMDTSGSVGDEELSQFHAEMVRLHNMGITLTVIECDAQVNAIYKFDPKKEFKVSGRGGTRFAPVFKAVEELPEQVDGLIYMTDGECWGEDIKKPNYTVLWALTPPYHADTLPKWYNGGTKAASHTKIEIKKKVRR